MVGRGQKYVQPPSVEEGRLPGLGELVAEKYRVERVLGMGGMGAVLSARHETLGHVVALKVLVPAASESEESVTRFMREAQAAASLESDHVVRIFDVGTLESGMPFMVMERLLGQDLGQILAERGPFSVESAVECLYQAALGVADAHTAGLVHRDLKPANLFCTRRRDGSVWIKVLDFGISKALSEAEDELRLTSTRTWVGSPLYMSPEQVRSSKLVDQRSDLWSLGVILHELLRGHPPFEGDSLPSVGARIVVDPPARLEREDVPLALHVILDRLLEKDPARRYGSAAELAQALSPLRPTQPLPFAQIAAIEHTLPESRPRSSIEPIRFGFDPREELDFTPITGLSKSLPGGPERSGDLSADRQDLTLDSGALTEAVRDAVLSEVERQVVTLYSERPEESRKALPESGTAAPLLDVASVSWTPQRRAFAFGAVVGLGLALGWALSFRGAAGEEPNPARSEVSTPDPSPAPLSLRIDSNPRGAEVRQGGVYRGKTPLVLSVPPGGTEPLRYELRLAGHAPVELIEPPLVRDSELRVELPALQEPASAAEAEVSNPVDKPSRTQRRPPPTDAPADTDDDPGIRLRR